MASLNVFEAVMEMPELAALALVGGYALVAKQSCKQSLDRIICRQFKAAVPKSEQPKVMAGFLGALLFLSISFDWQSFTLAIVSALAYLALHQFSQKTTPKTCCAAGRFDRISKDPTVIKEQDAHPWKKAQKAPAKLYSPPGAAQAKRVNFAEVPRAQPVGLDACITAMVESSMPTAADEAIAAKIANLTRRCIISLVPEAEVSCIVSNNLKLVSNTGDKPEVEVIVSIDPQVLAARLQKYFAEGPSGIGSQKIQEKLAPDAIQKTATKMLSEKLNFVRYWRSQFSGPECLIVLLISETLGVADFPICMNFSVNTPNPLRLNALRSKAGGDCKELMALVLRWSRERGVKNVARGQLNKYAWGLLVIHFCKRNEGVAEGHLNMFKAFMTFCAEWVKQPEPICFSGQDVDIPADKRVFKLPYIEDLYLPGTDAAALTSADGMARIQEEVNRAVTIMEQGNDAKFDELFARWVPEFVEQHENGRQTSVSWPVPAKSC